MLDQLAGDVAASASRVSACEAVTQALAHVGRLLWVGGYIVGSDLKTKTSPFGFGEDATVGVATVAQIGGQLGIGATDLLKSGNLYAASALIRQLVEVEYLASAFAEQHETAAAWLRADRKERLAFWSPVKLRNRAGGRFLASDYSHHCEMGGHPTTRGMRLLPDHALLHEGYLWVDLAGHLVSIWKQVAVSTQRWFDRPVDVQLGIPDVEAVIDTWRRSDGLYAALQDLGATLRETTEE